jgi:hypothetical protein
VVPAIRGYSAPYRRIHARPPVVASERLRELRTNETKNERTKDEERGTKNESTSSFVLGFVLRSSFRKGGR